MLYFRKTRLCEGVVCCTVVSVGAISLVQDPQPSFVFGCRADKRRANQIPLDLDEDMLGKVVLELLEEHCHLRLSITAEDRGPDGPKAALQLKCSLQDYVSPILSSEDSAMGCSATFDVAGGAPHSAGVPQGCHLIEEQPSNHQLFVVLE